MCEEIFREYESVLCLARAPKPMTTASAAMEHRFSRNSFVTTVRLLFAPFLDRLCRLRATPPLGRLKTLSANQFRSEKTRRAETNVAVHRLCTCGYEEASSNPRDRRRTRSVHHALFCSEPAASRRRGDQLPRPVFLTGECNSHGGRVFRVRSLS